jgi:hypothetical protein
MTPVQDVHQVHEILRRAVAGRRREVAGRLVAPGAVEGVLGDRHQLDVRVAELVHVFDQAMRGVAIAEPATIFGAAPGAEVQFVDRDRRIEGIRARTIPHPCFVAPVVIEGPHPRCRGGRRLGREGERIGLLEMTIALGGFDPVLVAAAVAGLRYDAFPDARTVPARSERMRLGIPARPVCDHRDVPCVGGPHGEAMTGAVRLRMTAQAAIESRVGAFPEEIDVVIGQHV